MKYVYVGGLIAIALMGGLLAWVLILWLSKPRTRPPSGILSSPSWSSRVKNGLAWIGMSIPVLLVIAFAAMFNWKNSWAKAPWEWVTTNWVFSLAIVGLTVFVWLPSLRKSSGTGFKITAKGVRATLLTLAGVWLVAALGSWFYHMAQEHPCPFTAPNAVAEARENPPFSPSEIKTGVWEISVSPGQWSEWIGFHRGYTTRVDPKTRGSVRLVQIGQINGRKITNETAPRLVSTDEELVFQVGEAVRYSSISNIVVFEVRRKIGY